MLTISQYPGGSMSIDNLTQEQVQALFEAGGFVIISDLPQGSEFGIDGTYHITRKFSGIKFLPPGLHLITVSPPGSSSVGEQLNIGPSTLPIRSGILRFTSPREHLVLRYNREHEELVCENGDGSTTVISDDRLKSLDSELAGYPFDKLVEWKSLVNHISPDILRQVLGPSSAVDGLKAVEGEGEDDESPAAVSRSKERQAMGEGIGSTEVVQGERLSLVRFRLKRSWREGAVGEEVTRYSRDKSWLLGHVVTTQLLGNPYGLLAQLQLSFILLLHLSSYSALIVYKRILSLLTQSSDLLVDPSTYLPDIDIRAVKTLLVSLIEALTAQLVALPEGVFDTELPELDAYFMDELENLRVNINAASSHWAGPVKQTVDIAWRDLQSKCKARWGWTIDGLSEARPQSDEESDEEEGEYAPVIVDM